MAYDPLFDPPISVESVKGHKGDPGLSVYQLAVKNGFEGSEVEFLESLKGEDGETITNEVVREIIKEQPIIKTEIVKEVIKEKPLKGIKGDSAYEHWKSLGNRGSIEDFILSLRGDDGLSAYDIWLDQGHEGTEEKFLEWLKGEDGKHTYSTGGGSAGLLGAGDVGRLNSKPSANSTDDIMILRAGSLFRVAYSDFTGDFVPYTGATQPVDLNGQSFSNFSYLGFKIDAGAPSFSEGQSYWDTVDKTLAIQTDQTGVTLQTGQEFHARVLNNSGVTINNGEVVYYSGSDAASGRPTVAKAIASNPALVQFAFGAATHDIGDGEEGIITTEGLVRDLDTSGLVAGAPVYLSTDTAGALTSVRPSFPNYRAFVGGCISSDASSGVIYISPDRNAIGNIYDNFFNANFLEPITFTVSSNGATVTGSLEQTGGGDLTLNYSTGLTKLDTTPAATITLNAGSSTVPTENYIYIPISTKVLTVSTSYWPSEEHIKVSRTLLLDATTTQSYGALKQHSHNDHLAETNDNGHAQAINDRLRQIPAAWDSGVTPTIDITTNGGAADNVYLSTTSGFVYQLHRQTIPATDTSVSSVVFVVNDFATPYEIESDLANILTDSTGSSMASSYFNLVLWGSANSDGTITMFINLPSGSYSNEDNAINDVDNFDDTSIPSAYRGTGFLISRFTFRHQNASGGTWTLSNTKDLRGVVPSASGGGSTGTAITSFSDNQFEITNVTDSSKVAMFDASNITTATTRTYTLPDTNGTVITTGNLEDITSISPNTVNKELTAAVTLADGDLCYMNASGKMDKADADAEATADTFLAICTEAISADAVGTFTVSGEYTTTGLTAGSNYYVSTTAGAITATAPSATGDIVRLVGTALSTTVLLFTPDSTYIEVG